MRSILLASAALLATSAALAASPTETHALAISWEPAFCLTNPSKPECQSETPSRADAQQFSMHGLWPQSGSYCGISSSDKSLDEDGDWDQLPAVELDDSTWQWLNTDMPGTQSYLERHEWTEHGSCSGAAQEDFFTAELSMLDSINQSNLGALVAQNVGGSVTLASLRSAAAIDYGKYAKTDIEYLCVSSGGKSWLEEVRFHMHLPSTLPQTVEASYMAAPVRPASSSQLCKSSGKIYIRAVD